MAVGWRSMACLCAIGMLVAERPAVAAGWPAGTAVSPVYREIGDWLLGCDNTRRCVARYVPEDDGALQGDDNGDVFGMTIVREEGPIGLQIGLSGIGSLRADAMLVDGRAAPKVTWVGSADRDGAKAVDDAALRFLRGIAAAHELTVPAKTRRQSVSLKGLTAVLLAIDEVQGRLGNRSAIVRVGPKPSGATPRVVPLPVITVRRSSAMPGGAVFAAAVRRGQSALLKAHECDMDPGIGDGADLLPNGKALVVIGCGRFAYQTSSLAFVGDPGNPRSARLLVLPQPPIIDQPSEPNTAGEYVELVFDPARSTLAEFSKGRGMADCGSRTEWAFDGATFRLATFEWQQRCGGDRDMWLALYRTELKITDRTRG